MEQRDWECPSQGLGAATRPRTHLSTGRESGAWIPARISRAFSFHRRRDPLSPSEPRAWPAATSRTLQGRGGEGDEVGSAG